MATTIRGTTAQACGLALRPLLLSVLVTLLRFFGERSDLPNVLTFFVGVIWLTLIVAAYWGWKFAKGESPHLLLFVSLLVFALLSRIPIVLLWWVTASRLLGTHYDMYRDLRQALLFQFGVSASFQIAAGFLVGSLAIGLSRWRSRNESREGLLTLRPGMAGMPAREGAWTDRFGRVWGTFLVLLLVCAFMRIVASFAYEPYVAPDTGTYQRFANQIARWDFSAYDGTRTPGYPLLMLLAGREPHRLRAFQSLLGIGVSALLFVVAYRCSRSPLVSLLAGLIPTLSLNLLFFESALLTEPVSGFLLVLSVTLFLWLVDGKRPRVAALALGLVGGVLGLTHPLFAFSGPLFGLCIVVFANRDRLLAAAIVVVVALAPVIGWMALNERVLGAFTITTYTGFNLTNHSGGFMEFAPPSVIRDIYLQYREEKRAETGRHSMTIYLARAEIERRTGLSTAELSTELTRMSLALFRNHPGLYLRSVAEQWLGFWAVPRYWQDDHFRSPVVRDLARMVWKLEHPVLRFGNLVFLALCGPLLMLALQGRSARASVKVLTTSTLLIFTASAVQALFEFGNTRYSIPTQALAGCVVLVSGYELYRLSRSRQPAAEVDGS
jgi:hypothetical protein